MSENTEAWYGERSVNWHSGFLAQRDGLRDDARTMTVTAQQATRSADHELTPMHVSLPDQAADARGRTESLLSIVGAGDSLVTDDHHDPLALVKVNAQACRRIAASIAAKPIPEDREDVSL